MCCFEPKFLLLTVSCALVRSINAELKQAGDGSGGDRFGPTMSTFVAEVRFLVQK